MSNVENSSDLSDQANPNAGISQPENTPTEVLPEELPGEPLGELSGELSGVLPKEKEESMPVVSVLPLQRKEVLAMLYEMKFLTADKWEEERLLKRLYSLPKMLKEGTVSEPQSSEYRNLLAHICSAVMEGTELEFEQTYHLNGATPSATGDSHKKIGGIPLQASGSNKKGFSTMSTATMEKPADKAAPKANKPKENKDSFDKRFGCRIGSARHKFVQQLSNKPKAMKVLIEGAGLDEKQTMYNYANNLVAKGLVEKVEEGYKLAPKKE